MIQHLGVAVLVIAAAGYSVWSLVLRSRRAKGRACTGCATCGGCAGKAGPDP